MIQVGDFGSSGKPSGSVCWLVQGGPDCKAAAAPTRQAPARPQAGQREDPWTAALNLYHLILHVRGVVRNGFLDCGFWGSGARIEMQAWHPFDSSKLNNHDPLTRKEVPQKGVHACDVGGPVDSTNVLNGNAHLAQGFNAHHRNRGCARLPDWG